ncbi:tetratricopeptide repeat protein, partial [Methanoregula sp.]|uniref:tetratricopeptide repeat protein n=1 Tax=Methanoregula sp. TaxID=2052170 RepID=UPI000CC2256F
YSYGMKIRQIVTILAILAMVALCVQPVYAQEESPQITDEATLFYNNAQLLIDGGDYARALDMLDRVLASNTTLLGMGDGLMYTYKDRIALLTDLGRYDEAIAAADQATALYPREPGIWNNKGWAYYQMGKYNEAADAYDHAIRVNATYLKAYLNKGDALMKAGKPREAADAYRKALELDPGNTHATGGLNEVQAAAGPDLLIPSIVILVIIAGGLIFWYMSRKPADDIAAGKAKGKK